MTFVLLCLLARAAYSFNDVFIGRLAREMSGVEVAAWRGVSLGVTMSPWLVAVPSEAWTLLAARPGHVLLLAALTATANLLQLAAARYLPFGLRASVMLSGIALGSVALGRWAFAERLSLIQGLLCVVLVACGCVAALGRYQQPGVNVNLPRGCLLTLRS
jgi:drug/metabolite transporter (DMT)-like permease